MYQPRAAVSHQEKQCFIALEGLTYYVWAKEGVTGKAPGIVCLVLVWWSEVFLGKVPKIKQNTTRH